MEYIIKNITCSLLLSSLILFSCTPESSFDFQLPPEKIRYLKYVYEDDNLVKSFEYEGDRLIKYMAYSDNDVSSIQFIYSENGLVDSAYMVEKKIKRDLVFLYQDSLVSELKVWMNNQLRYRIVFDRDRIGRIIRMSWINSNYGFVRDDYFVWDGYNITRQESKSYNGFDNPTDLYEFSNYDQLWNPYNTVFKKVGFNLLNFKPLPLSENNWVEMVYYKKGDYGNKVTCINKFSYSGRYPYVNEFIVQDENNRHQIYVEYNYKNTLH